MSDYNNDSNTNDDDQDPEKIKLKRAADAFRSSFGVGPGPTPKPSSTDFSKQYKKEDDATDAAKRDQENSGGLAAVIARRLKQLRGDN